MAEKDLRINEQIRVREVRLIDDTGGQQGVLSTADAIRMAREAGLDLVEIAPQSVPPVCKILNYGKFKFEQEKKTKDTRKKSKGGELKEIRLQPKIALHDLDFKSSHVQDFLNQGHKVKVTVRFRGRELAHIDRGEVLLKTILGKLDGHFVVERSPLMEGKFMSMVLAPKAGQAKKVDHDHAPAHVAPAAPVTPAPSPAAKE